MISLALAVLVLPILAASDPSQSDQTDSSNTIAEPTVPTDDLIRKAKELLDRADQSIVSAERQKMAEQVLGLVDELRSREPTNVWLVYLSGRVHALSQRGAEARDELRKFLETKEGRNEWTAFRTLGELFVQEFPRLARGHFEQALRLRPQEPNCLLDLSICDWRLGNMTSALQFAQLAASVDGKRNVRFVSHLASVLAANKQWPQAEIEATTAVQLADDAGKQSSGVREYVQRLDNQYNLLIEIIQARIKESPGDAENYLRLVDVQRRRADVRAKLRQYDVLATLELGMNNATPPIPISLRERFGIALVDVGRIEDAIEQFKSILETYPDHALAMEWLSKLQPSQPSSR